MKCCTTCKELKYENEFAKRSDSDDGLQYKCRDCKRAYWKENKEHQNEYQKKKYHSDINFRMKMCMSVRLSLSRHSETLEKYRDCTDD